MNIHPEVLKEIEAGPQEVSGFMDDDADSQRETVRQETPEEFARRIAALQQELDAVCAWSMGMEEHKKQHGLPVDARNRGSNIAAAIRRRGKP